MLSQQEFIKTINRWDDVFTKDTLVKAYEKLSLDASKKYIVVVVDSLNPNFTVSQSTDKELKATLTSIIKDYRESVIAYIPRILILDLQTGFKFEDPTEWSRFLLTQN